MLTRTLDAPSQFVSNLNWGLNVVEKDIVCFNLNWQFHAILAYLNVEVDLSPVI